VHKIIPVGNTGLAKVAVECFAETFVVNLDSYRDATFAKLKTVKTLKR
jgi:hypothetical protein